MSNPPINSELTEPVLRSSEISEQDTGTLKHKPKPIAVAILGGVLIALGGVAWFYGLRHSSEPISTGTAPAAPVRVEIKLLTKEFISDLRLLTGTVEPVETVTVTSRVMGQIKSLSVEEGDRVKAGQVIAKIDVKDIQAQRDAAQAAISQAQAGTIVAQTAQNQALSLASQAIAQSNQATARKRQAEAQLTEAQVSLADAQLHQRRMTMLRSEGVVSQSQLDEANTRVATIETRIQQAIALIEQANREIEQAQAGVKQAEAGVEQARAGVKQSLSQLARAKAEKEQTLANLDYGTVIAPFDGVVTRKHTEVGAMAGSGQPLVTLESTNRLRFSVEVPESLIAQVRQGDLVKVRLDAIDRALDGRVRQIIPSANPNSRSFTIKIALEKSAHLIPGMFGRLELPGGTKETITIPIEALMRRGQLEGVYVVGVDRQAELRWIKTGKTSDGQVEIVSGLVAGDRLITSNIEKLSDGQPIAIEN
jgi:RND family efflux transporter MFP subunit